MARVTTPDTKGGSKGSTVYRQLVIEMVVGSFRNECRGSFFLAGTGCPKRINSGLITPPPFKLVDVRCMIWIYNKGIIHKPSSQEPVMFSPSEEPNGNFFVRHHMRVMELPAFSNIRSHNNVHDGEPVSIRLPEFSLCKSVLLWEGRDVEGMFSYAVAENYLMEFESVVELDLIKCHCRKHRKGYVEFEVCHLKDGLQDRTGIKQIFWLEVIHFKDMAEVGEIVRRKQGKGKLGTILCHGCCSLGRVNDGSPVYCLGYASRVRVQEWSVRIVDRIVEFKARFSWTHIRQIEYMCFVGRRRVGRRRISRIA